MGICATSSAGPASEAEKKRNRDLQAKLKADQKQFDAIHKMLLLGAGESGKSTLFKQMQIIYGKDPFPEEERASYRQIIFSNVIDSMAMLITQASVYSPQPLDKNEQGEDLTKAVSIIQALDASVDIVDEEVGEAVKILWKHPAIHAAYDNRAKFQLTDSAAYYFKEIETISHPDYLPTQEHVLRSRSRTTGVIEKTFEIKGNTFTMYDVGGQRSERKKWIHCFENVTCVLFVCAISAYDQVLYEDNKQNRMVEALELFDEICNSRWFCKSSMVLFLNKRDLFADKVERVPLTVCPALEAYDGPMAYDAAVDFIMQEFDHRNKAQDTKEVYMHVTCATDQDNVAIVFESVKETVIKNSLKAAGLVM